jgi:hypothetical protein
MKFSTGLLLLHLLATLVSCAQSSSAATELRSVAGEGFAVAVWPPRIHIRFEIVNNIPVVQATVDGKTGSFLLDTGAEATLLNNTYFKGAALAEPRGSGSTGAFQQVSLYRVKQFDWQGIQFGNADVATLNLDHLSVNGQPVLGLIGADLLTHYAVTLDYASKKLLLETPAAKQLLSPARLTLPFGLQGHLPVIPVAIAGKEYNLTIDSGASINMLSAKLFPELVNELLHVSESTFSGADSKAGTGQTGTLRRAVLGNKLLLLNMPTIFTSIGPLAVSKPKPIDGILGYEFLRQYQVMIDYPGQKIELR